MASSAESPRPSTGADGWGPWRSDPPPGFVPFPAPAAARTVHDRFFDVAAERPEAVALSSPGGRWTFAELAALVRSRAGALQAHPAASPGAPICLLLDHDGPLVTAILSVIAAGQVVVVLDPAAPAAAAAHVITECGAHLLVHDDSNADLAAQLADGARHLEVVHVDELDGEAAYTPPAVDLADPVMLAFTSGTSGGSKGAIITHGVLLNLVRGASDALGITAADRMPMLFPTSMAVAAYPMFLPLLNGGTLATLDVRSVGLAPVGEFLRRERITLAYMAPTVVRFLVDSLGTEPFDDLRMIALGGELVDAEAVRITADAFDPVHLANGFGTTETGVITLHVFTPDDTFEGPVPAGHPVPDVELLILDDHGQPVPDGVAGEVAIVSPYVFTGYWGHHELDQQVLAPDPAGRPGRQRYRTGDLGRIGPDGSLTVLGRLDAKVKIRGRFVVVGDVEADLHQLGEVADAAAAAVERDGVQELVAVIVVADGHVFDPAGVRAQLLASSEAYRVPSRWSVVDELPKLPNGKLDRLAVADLAARAADGEHPAASASGSGPEPVGLVRTIRSIWERLLPAGVVELDDDFQHLGGDSLLAAQMLVMVEEQTGVTVPMGQLIDARTLRQLVTVVDELRRAGDVEPTTAAVVQAGDASRPRLWFVHDLQGSAYRIRHLAASVGTDQPVWSFESPLLRGIPDPFEDLEDLAARYVADLRTVQPHGPYWLAGYSFGGITAYEMARQLTAAGQEVAFCGVVDVGPGYRGPGWGDGRSPLRPWFGVAHPPPPGSSMREVADHYLAMGRRSPSGLARHLVIRSGLFRLVDPPRFRADLRRRGRVRPEWRLWYAWEEHWRLAARAWDRDNRYPGRVTLFWADDTPSADATLGWGPLVGDLDIHRFAGDHEGILEPRGAPHLATVLRKAIDDELARHPAPKEP